MFVVGDIIQTILDAFFWDTLYIAWDIQILIIFFKLQIQQNKDWVE